MGKENFAGEAKMLTTDGRGRREKERAGHLRRAGCGQGQRHGCTRGQGLGVTYVWVLLTLLVSV